MADYSKLNNKDFDRILAQIIDDRNLLGWDLLQIPGIYEILSEWYNNEVLERWEEEQIEKYMDDGTDEPPTY